VWAGYARIRRRERAGAGPGEFVVVSGVDGQRRAGERARVDYARRRDARRERRREEGEGGGRRVKVMSASDAAVDGG